MNKNNRGFSVVEVLIVLVVIGVIGAASFMFMNKKGSTSSTKNSAPQTSAAKPLVSQDKIIWSNNGSAWKSESTPPACPSPLGIASPIDTSKTVSILYPGQYRGGQYKPHGGFRFADGTNKTIDVTLPMDAALYTGSRYTESGETQYLLVFISNCGIMFKFDHLLVLTSEFQKIAEDNFPPAKENDSRTTNLSKYHSYKAGTKIATGVGFPKTNNSAVDFGVYDLRNKNKISSNSSWASMHTDDSEYAPYSICWLDILSNGDTAKAKALPGADGVSGKISDVCTTSSGNTLTNTVGNPGSEGAASSAAAASSAGGGTGRGTGAGRR